MSCEPRLTRLVQIAFVVALLTAAARFPDRFQQFVLPVLPVVRLLANPEAQHRLQLGDVPYDMLRAVDAILPRDASVLLVTNGHDVRHLEYTTFHRALYYLTPRPVWWMSPAPSDGTWESRWWISAPLTVEAVRSVAADKGASYVLAYAVPQVLPIGRRVADWEAGYLLQLAESASTPSDQPVRPIGAGPLWPAQVFLAVATIMAIGDLALTGIARLGYRARGIEAAALAWSVGAGLVSIGMLWLNAMGLSLSGQIAALTLLAVGWSKCRLKPAFRSLWPSVQTGSKDFKGLLRVACPLQGMVALWLIFRQSLSQNWLKATPRPLRDRRNVSSVLVLCFFALQLAFVTILAIGQPLSVWDSWSSWGMRARTIFLEGSISPVVYADPSRASTLPHYPLLIPLVEAWLYGWLSASDDRLVGVIFVLFYLALAGICYSAIRRRGGSQAWALAVMVVVTALPNIALLTGLAFVDIPLAILVVVSAMYLLEWLDGGSAGTLAVASVAAGLMPWAKREGWVLVAVLCLAAIIHRGHSARRAWLGVTACLLAAASFSGAWWMFVATQGSAGSEFLPVTLATARSNFSRLPTIARMTLADIFSPDWSFIWPLAVASSLIGKRGSVTATRSAPTARRTVNLLLTSSWLYLSLMSLAYIFSAFVPYEQHVASSFYRLIAHVVPLPVLWMACHGIGRSSSDQMDMLEGWRIAKVLPLIQGRLLDVGCGFNNLVRAYGRGVGVDVFPWQGIDILIGSAARLPCPDSSFNTVTIVAALNHIPNRAETLLEIRRVLRPAGRLIVTMIGPKTGVLAHVLFGRDEHTRGGMRPGETRGMTRQEVMRLLAEQGFSVMQDIPFQFGLNRVFVAIKQGDR